MSSNDDLQGKIDSVIDLFNNGKLNKAIEKIDLINLDYPNNPILFNLAGACFFGLGQYENAVKNYKKAISIKPDFPDFHFNLGNSYMELGKLNNAVECFKKVLIYIPENFPTLFNLAASYQKLEEFDEAIEQYQSAIKFNNDSQSNKIRALTNLGYVFHEIGELDEAIEAYNQVLKLEPENVEVLNNLGTIYRDLDDTKISIEHYNAALSANPNHSGAYYNLGFAYQDLGDINKAIQNYEQAIEINDHVWSYHNLSYLKKFKLDDPHISKMESLLLQDNIPKLDQVHLNLALARVNDSLGRKKQFLQFLEKGNRLRKKETKYSIEESLYFHETIKEIFLHSMPVSKKPDKDSVSEITPIFILGMPRSGTTLVEQILSSHNSVYGAGELKTLTKLATPIINNYSNGDISNISLQALEFIRQEYLNMLSNLNSNLQIITDKLPLNFQFIGFILSAFPEAKIIHLKRNAIATCWSNYKHFFTDKENSYSHDLNDLAAFYNSYVDIMDFWHKLYPNKIYDLSYETLTTNQEDETRKLINYCNLEWDEKCLSFYENNRAVKTPSSPQVRNKMYQGSSDAWKQYEEFLKPLVKGLKSE